MRQFYDERNVVIEERRMRVDSNPIGRLLEQFTEEAFAAHPYHRPTIGWISDLNSFSATDAQNFFDKYYVPSNMVVAVVGDLKASDAMPIVEKYFSRIPARPKPDTATTVEPPQNSERTVVLHEQSQPLYLEGYHRPDYRSPDDQVYDAIADLMSNGRTSRLYRALVRDKQIASDSEGFTGLPGSKYPQLFAFYAFPIPGHTPQEMADAIHVEIDRLKKEDISDEELKMIKTRAKANLIRSLGSNEGLASELGIYQARYDDWRELFRSVDRIEKVTKADIRRVANQTFAAENRTVGIIEFSGGPPGAGAGAGQRLREVDSEEDKLLLVFFAVVLAGLFTCTTNSPLWAQPQPTSPPTLAADPDPQVAGVSSRAAKAHRAAQWHGDFPSGRPRVANHRRDGSHSRR